MMGFMTIPLGWLVARFSNLHRVQPGLYRSAQLYGRAPGLIIRYLKLASLINLRGENTNAGWYQAETAACAAAGIRHFDVRISSKRLPQRDSLLDIVTLYDTAPRPALFKCSGGADRTSLAAGMFLLLAGQPLTIARKQTNFLPYLHRPRREQQWIRGFFDFVAAEGAETRLRDWLATEYDDQRFADFLRGRGMGDAWRA